MIEEKTLREELFGVDVSDLKPKDMLSYLTAFLVLGGEMSIGKSPKVGLTFRHTDSAFWAVECIARLYGYRPELGIGLGGKQKKAVWLELPHDVGRRLLQDCHMLKVADDGKVTYTLGLGSMRWVKDGPYLAALTMECGRLYVGEDYRLDLAMSVGGRRQNELEKILTHYGVRYGITESDEKIRVSIRREAVAEYLALIGASQSSLAVTEYYFERNVNRSVNRAVNCSTSNMDKSYRAATHQLWAIGVLKEKGRYQLLAKEVRAVGDMRMQNRDASLQAIADNLGINKTAVYRRMKVITDEAEQYRGE